MANDETAGTRPTSAQITEWLFDLVESRLQELFGLLTDEELRVLLAKRLTESELRVLLRRIALMPDEPSTVPDEPKKAS